MADQWGTSDAIVKPKTVEEFGTNDEVAQHGALRRGWNKMTQSVGLTSDLATGDYKGAASRLAEISDYQQKNPGTPEGKKLIDAWNKGDGISGGLSEVGGAIAKDWDESKGALAKLRSVGRNVSAMGQGVLEQTPNMVAPMSGMLAGGVAGSLVYPVVGTAVGGWAGASLGNTAVEGGGMTQEALQKAGINPADKAATEAYLKENGDSLLTQAGVKGSIIGAVDTLTAGLGHAVLTAPAKAAAGRAITAMGIDVADKAAVKAASSEIAARMAADPVYLAATSGVKNVARNASVAALEPGGEFAGEYVGQGAATGEWDTKNAFLEAASSIGQGAATFAGQKLYAGMSAPFGAGDAIAAPATTPPVSPPGPDLSLDPNAQLAAVQSEEMGAPNVAQTTPPDGRAVLNAQQEQERQQREAQLAAQRAVSSPDDEIFASTGAIDPKHQTISAILATVPDGQAPGVLARTAISALESGQTKQIEFANASAQDQDAYEQAALDTTPSGSAPHQDQSQYPIGSLYAEVGPHQIEKVRQYGGHSQSTTSDLSGSNTLSVLPGLADPALRDAEYFQSGNPQSEVASTPVPPQQTRQDFVPKTNSPRRNTLSNQNLEDQKQSPFETFSGTDNEFGNFNKKKMSEEDKRAVLFSNQAVADGGQRFVGTQDGDILNGMAAPFATRMAAARRANLEGKDWTIAPVFDGWVARRKDAFNVSDSNGVQPVPTASSGNDGNNAGAGVGTGIDSGNGLGANTGGREADALVQSGEPAGGNDAGALTKEPEAKTNSAPTATESIANVQNPEARTQAEPQAEAARNQAPEAVASDAAPAAELPGAGSAAVESDGLANPDIQALQKEVDDARAAWQLSHAEPVGQRLRDATAALEAAQVSQPAQPGVPGEGAGVSQPTQEAKPNQKALDRIAKGTAYFGTNLKAAKFIADNGLKDTHEWVKTGASRFEVREKATTQEALQVPSERETRIASALANGGHVVGADLRDRTGMRLMGLTPEELKTIPADKVRAKPSAEAARTNSTTKGNEDGTQAAQAQPQQTQPEAGANSSVSEPATGAGVGGATEGVEKRTVESVARAIQQKVASNRRKYREKSRKEREAKGYAPNSTSESEQADYDTEISAEPGEHQQKSATALLGNDPLPLIDMFVNGNFEASEDVFKEITGVRIRGLSAKDKKAALYKWANWTPKQIAQAEQSASDKDAARSEKLKQDDLKSSVMGAWLALDKLQVGETKVSGTETGQEFVIRTIASGFDKAHSQKKGVAPIYGFTDGKSFTTLKNGALTKFVKAAIAFGGLDKTMEYVNPPKPEAPAGFVDRSVETKKPNKLKQAAQDLSKARADYFTPGNIVNSYGGQDEVLSYTENDNGGFSVKVHAVRKVGDNWVRQGKPQDARTHSTQPDAKELAKGPVDRLGYQAAGEVQYSEPRADGKPFPNAVDRGAAPVSNTQTADDELLSQEAIDRIKKNLNDPAKTEQVMGDIQKQVDAATPAQREPTEHAGLKIYPVNVKVGDKVEQKWGVQTLNNSEREKKGERQLGGDPLADTLEGAKKLAEQEVEGAKRLEAYRAEMAALDDKKKEADAVAQSKKDANKGKSIAERRKDSILDGPTKLHPNAGLGTGTKREAMQKAVEQDRYIQSAMVRDEAAKKRDQESTERARRNNLPTGNINYPGVKEYFEAVARLKADDYTKPEYRVYDGRDTKGAFREISKTEYDYAQELKGKQSVAPADTAQAATETVAKPERQYHLVAINEKTGAKTFLTRTPMTHAEAVTMKGKYDDKPGRRIQLEDVTPVEPASNPLDVPTDAQTQSTDAVKVGRFDHIQVPDETTRWMGFDGRKTVKADLQALAQRHSEYYQTAQQVRDDIEFVLGNPDGWYIHKDNKVVLFRERMGVGAIPQARVEVEAEADSMSVRSVYIGGKRQIAKKMADKKSILSGLDLGGQSPESLTISEYLKALGNGSSRPTSPSDEALKVVDSLTTADPEVKTLTPADVAAAEKQAIGVLQAAIDKMKAQEAQRFAARFLPTMGVNVPVGKARINAAMTDPKINLLGAADALNVSFAKSIVDTLEAKQEGRVADVADPKKVEKPVAAPIGDFGQKIGGAKKDTWTGFKDDLSAVKDDEIAGRKLSEIWPAPDYQKLIDDGMDVHSVAIIRSLRDEIPAKPRNAYKLSRWADQVQTLRALATNIMNGKDTGPSIAGFLERGNGPSKGIAGRADLYMAVGHDKSLEGIRLAHRHYSLYRGRENVNLWVAERDSGATAFSNWPQELATGDTKEDAIAAFKARYAELDSVAAVKKASFDIITETGKKGFFIGKKIGRNIATLAGPFDTVQEARAYRQSNLAALDEKLAKYKEIPKDRRDTNEPRVGEDMRNGQDVTPEMFAEAFGFKGVEFGNWVEQKRRQKDLNDAYDALMDMAAIMGVPAKAISLNGELGLAFGARGSGGVNPAAAHYESDKIVINLTKREGAGSLGHEWWHAVDNYFSRMRGGQTSPFMTTATDVGLSARGSQYVAYPGVRKEMIDAFGEVVRSIRATAMKVRSSKMDAKRTKEYWTTGEEMAARAFESYLISKLQDQDASNDYLANVVDQKTWDAMAAMGMQNEDSYPYPTAGEMPTIRAGFDKFFQTLETKETEGGNVAMFSRPTFSRGAQSQANESVERLATGIASHWENAPKVVVAFDMNDPRIDEEVRKEDQRQRSGGAKGTPEGFYYEGTVYLMSSKLGTPNDIARVLFHEALGHYGLRGTFGKALRPILRDVAMLRRAEVDAKIKQYGLKMGNTLDRFTAAEEVLAELAQTKPEIGFVQRAIAAIRTWLRQNVPGFNNLRLTDAELIRSFIIPARDYVTKSGVRSASLSGDVRPSSNQSTADSGRSFTNRFSNLAQSLAFKEKGINSLDAPSQRVMLSHVFSAMQDFKIADSVISLLPIDMVNMLTGEKFSTKKVLHNKAMLKNLLTVPGGNQSIPLAADGASALIEAVAYVTANHGGGAHFGKNSLTWLPAMSAVEADSLGFGYGRSAIRATANNSINGLLNAAGGSIKFSGAMGTLDDRHVVTPISDNVLGARGVDASLAPPSLRATVKNTSGNDGRVEPTFSRGKDGKSSVLSKHGFFNAWPKFNSWTRAEYKDVVSLLPKEYRYDSYRREPLPTQDRDARTAAALPEIKELNSGIGGAKGFGVDGLGNIVADMRDGVSTRDLIKAADIADKHGLGVFVTGVRTGSIPGLMDAGFVSEMGLGGVLARVTKSSAPVMPMASGVVNNTAYGTMMAYKPRGFAAPMFSRGTNDPMTNNDVVGNQGGRSADDSTPGALSPVEAVKKAARDAFATYQKRTGAEGNAASFEVDDNNTPVPFRAGAAEQELENLGWDIGDRTAAYASNDASHYITARKLVASDAEYGDEYVTAKIRISNHGNTTRAHDYPDVNIAPGEDIVWDIEEKLNQKITDEGYELPVSAPSDARLGYAIATEQAQRGKPSEGSEGNINTNESTAPDSGGAMFSRSLGETLTTAANNFVVPDIGKKFGNRLADFRGIALQALGRRQLVDIYGKDLPQLAAYSDMVAQMDADKNEAGAEADALATEWGKLDESPMGGLAKHPGMERKLAELMHDATLAQIDPDKEFVAGDDVDQYQALRDGFEQLSPKAQAAYRKARGMYADHNEKVRQAIRERIERSELSPAKRKALLERMDGEFFQKVKGVYFPLARFGQYLTIVKDSEGTVLNVSRSETLNEADETRKILLKEYPASGGFTVGKVLKEKEFNAARDGVGRGFMADLFETLEKTEAGEELIDSISQLYLAALPDLSWAKHGIHRKGTPGFSQDARRAFAQNMFHGARYLAKLRYADQLQTHLDGMQEHIGAKSDDDGFDSVKAQQVADEMVKRHDSMMNPESHPISTALTSFGFVFHLGLSPASAMVNLSQTALVALPVMGAKWGFGKSSAALLTASKQAASNRNDISKVLKGDELRAYNEAVRSGVIDVTMAHDLAGIAQGEDSKVAAKVRPVMKWASFLFHHAEKFNRQVTFVAAYRLAREAGAEHSKAYADAVKATYDGHFDYSASNRARLLQGNWQKVILLFKQYAQNMIYTLSRQAYQAVKAGTPQERKEARKALGGLLVAHAMAAGVLGLPVVGMLLSAASMVGGDDDEPWDAKVALQNMLADTLGQKPAEVIAHGLSRLTPWDISGRVGLDKLLLPDIQEGLSGTPAAQAMLASAAGPVAGIGVNMVKGLAEMGEGQYQRGLESMMPTALRGPLKAYRFAAEGNIDKTGVPINDEVSAAGIAGQALGLSPSETRLAQEGKSAIYSADRAVQARRSDLMRAYAMAAIDSDAEGMAEARQKIANFNERNPQSRIMLMQLMASVRARKKRIEESKQGVYLPKKRQDAMEAGRFAVVD